MRISDWSSDVCSSDLAFEPDRAIRHRGVEVGGRRKAAEAPFLLIPARSDDPRHFGIFGGIFADRRLRFGEAVRIRQVEQHPLETPPHHMAVRVDQSGAEGIALAILFEVGSFGALVRSEERRVGKGCVSACMSWGS